MTATAGHEADPASVSGRDKPRESGPPVSHDVRFRSSMVLDGLVAYCGPCEWSVQVEDGYTDAQLSRLASMHRGDPS